MARILHVLLAACMLNQAISQEIPSLTAIKLRSTLNKRDANFTPNLHCESFYVDRERTSNPTFPLEIVISQLNAIDASLLLSQSARFAKTIMHLNAPAISLEDLEYHIESVSCGRTSISVEFYDENVLHKAKKEWEKQSKFLVITSHEGCNPSGARTPYL